MLIGKTNTFLLIILMTFAIPAYAQIKWDMANEYSDTSIHGEGDKAFIQFLEEYSKGQIKVTLHAGGALGYKTADQFDAVGYGAIQIADSSVALFGGLNQIFLLSSLPFLTFSAQDAQLLFEIAKPHYEKVFEERNQILLYASPWPPSGIWAKKAITGKEQIKGLKIRTFDPIGTNTLKAAGASPIQLSWGDVVPQLSTGGIEAVLTSAEGGTFGHFWEYLSHFTEVNYAWPLTMIHLNKDEWNRLTPELKEAVRLAAQKASERNWKEVMKRQEKNYEKLREHNVTIVREMPQEFKAFFSKAGSGAVKEWIDKIGPLGQSIIDEFNRRKSAQ